MDYIKTSDKVLIEGYLQGDEFCLEKLIEKHQSRIYSYIISKVKDSDIANDIFQDTFVKVINTLKAGRYNEEGKFLPWVMRIAHNLVIDHFRREKRMPTINPTDEFDIFDIVKTPELNVEAQLISDQIHSDVKKLIEHLPEEQRKVLVLRIYNRMSFKEIAELTDVSINTALGRMRYALINLRKIIEQHNVILTQI
ncbi:MAG: sigma-70 family RNA polymerase sigma factor [Bacteroidota bacterium]|nr:sigma-70 family RNA polymerase sigma factor [Bacteroidota bacterium]MDX5427673.1 sigma-70 family RNA polymerase sigma factor [Bacteroidota bacterium]MDX5448663.1 sigma-70 family RNA polymerase sigma factor [Bacteroidota bacterium]MDX5505572.1 sigma-70 family RNA polymerase sigma factor [Bacteroidota bacterium]